VTAVTSVLSIFSRRATRFTADERGAAMIEFAVAVPLMLLMFSFVIEGTRLLWTHQVVVSGVRDVARYVSRVERRDVCTSGGTIDASGFSARVAQSFYSQSIMPGSATVGPVTLSAPVCHTGLRLDQVAVVTVAATISVDHPLGGLFGLFGVALAPLEYTVAEEARVQGE
jgi:Flp pilus assembly protein TadG